MPFNQNHAIRLPFAAVAAGTGETFYAALPAGKWKLTKASFTSWTARTANDTNYTTIAVKNGATTLASEATTTGDTGNLTAGGVLDLVITGTGTSLEFDGGDVISVTKTDAGSGLALDGEFLLEFEALR